MPLNYNPFQAGALRFPKKYQKDIKNYCQKDQKSDVLNSPFERIVDLWYLCVCIGSYYEEKKPVKDAYRFMDGSVLKDNYEMIETLEIIAIAENGDETVLENPNKMLETLNKYAFAGIEKVFSALSTGRSDSLWNLTDNLLQKIR